MKSSIATVSVSGDLAEKLDAIAAAGFDGYELFENDLTFSSIAPTELARRTTELGLELFALQPFRDFEGLLDARRTAVFDRAERKFDLMEALGTELLLIPSSCSPHATDRPERIVADLREIGDRAAQRGYRVGYEALAWGRHVRDWTAAWDLVRRADHPNIGLVLDTYHLFVRGNPVTPVADVPGDKIFIVQIADAPSLDMEVLRHSRHLRNFPGQGDYPIVEFMTTLVGTGFDGVVSHEIFNDEFRIAPPERIATDGYRSMLWLEDQVHAALPSDAHHPSWTHRDLGAGPAAASDVIDVGFVEFAVTDGEESNALHAFLGRVGFQRTHEHRAKDVSIYTFGGATIAVNAEASSYASSFADRRGAAACAIGLVVEDPDASYRRATAYLAEPMPMVSGGQAPDFPGVLSVGGVALHLLSADSSYLDRQFEPVGTSTTAADLAPTEARLIVDHIAQAIAPHELLSAQLFFRAVFGFDLLPPHDLVDPHGLVTSRAVVSPNGRVRFPLNSASGSDTSPERFRSAVHGSGVQHIAFSTSSIADVLDTIDPGVVLSIPDNYYADLEARFGLTGDKLAFLRDNNVLYDVDDAGGEFLHVYTEEIHGVFFEFVERRNYSGFGAANAPVRLAAHARRMRRISG